MGAIRVFLCSPSGDMVATATVTQGEPMGTIEAEEVLTVDRSSGTIHRRFRIPGSDTLLTFEADNLDAAGEFDIVESDTDPRIIHRCQRCFAVE